MIVTRESWRDARGHLMTDGTKRDVKLPLTI